MRILAAGSLLAAAMLAPAPALGQAPVVTPAPVSSIGSHGTSTHTATVVTGIDRSDPIVGRAMAIAEALVSQSKEAFQLAAPVDGATLAHHWEAKLRARKVSPIPTPAVIGRAFVIYVLGTLPRFLPVMRNFAITHVKRAGDGRVVHLRFFDRDRRVFARLQFVKGLLVDFALDDLSAAMVFAPACFPATDGELRQLGAACTALIDLRRRAVLGIADDAQIVREIAVAPLFSEAMKVIRAQVLSMNGKFDEAVGAWTEARSGAPIRTAQELGEIHLRRGRGDLALKEYLWLVSKLPGDEDLLIDVATAHLALGQVDEAEGRIKASLALVPGRANVRALRAMLRVLAARSHWAKIQRLLEKIGPGPWCEKGDPDLAGLEADPRFAPYFR